MREITKKDIGLLTISGLLSLVFWIYAPPFTPVLIYYGDAPYITIQNVGVKQATNVIVEFDPEYKLAINNINYTKLSGEIITNYTNHEQKIYHISHMYPKDRVFFYVEGDEKETAIDLIVRSNEVDGKPAVEYYGSVYQIITIVLIVVSIWFAYEIFRLGKKFLDKDITKQNSK